MNRGLFTSKTPEWSTPQDFFDRLDSEFKFTTDVCATEENAKCNRFYSPEQDGLSMEWEGVCWMNPPYGRTIAAWMLKAYSYGMKGGTVVCLVPARTDTLWWHSFAMLGEIRYVRGRLKFGKGGSAPFPSAVVIFGPKARVLPERTA
jgi:phage N-6-adenine-methyltransferase